MPTDKQINKYREFVDRFFNSDMPLAAWCSLNHVAQATMAKWIRYFIDHEPELFGDQTVAHAGDGQTQWIEAMRKAKKQSVALSVTAPGFISLDKAEPLSVSDDHYAPKVPNSNAGITVSVNGASITIPCGFNDLDVIRTVLITCQVS